MEFKEDRKVIEAIKLLVERGEAVIFLMLNPHKATLDLREKILRFREETASYGDKTSGASTAEKRKGAYPAKESFLIIDRKHPGTIKIDGKILQLTSKEFKLLLALAEHPSLCVSYRDIYDKVWGDEVAVEMQQIAYHKSQLIKKLFTIIPEEQAKTLIMTIASEGMVLNLRAAEVHIS